MKLTKKILAFMLMVIMIIGTLPASVFAVSGSTEQVKSTENSTSDTLSQLVSENFSSNPKHWKPIYTSNGISQVMQGKTGNKIRHIYLTDQTYLEADANRTTGFSPVVGDDVISFTRVDSYDNNGSTVDCTDSSIYGKAGTSAWISNQAVRFDGANVKSKIWAKNLAGLDTAITFNLKPNTTSGVGKAGIFANAQKSGSGSQPVHCILTVEADGNGNFLLQLGAGGATIATLPSDKFTKIQVLFDFGGDEIYNAGNSFIVFVNGTPVASSEFTANANLNNLYNEQKSWNEANGTNNHSGLSFQSLIFCAGTVVYDLKDIGVYNYDDTPEDYDITNAKRGNAFTLVHYNNFNTLETDRKYTKTDGEISRFISTYGKKTNVNFYDKNDSDFYAVDDGNGGKSLKLYDESSGPYFDLSFANLGSPYVDNSGKSFVLSFDLKAGAFASGGPLFSIGDRGAKMGSGKYETAIVPIFRDTDGSLYLGYDGNSVMYRQYLDANNIKGPWDGKYTLPETLKNGLLTKLSNDKFTNITVRIDNTKNVFTVYIDGVDKTGELTLFPAEARQIIKDSGFANGFAVTETRLLYGAMYKKTVYLDNLLAYYTSGAPIGDFNAKIKVGVSGKNELYDDFRQSGYKYENGAYYYYENGVIVGNKTTPDGILTVDANGKLMDGNVVVTDITDYYVTLSNGETVAVDGKFNGSEYTADLILGNKEGRKYYYVGGNRIKNQSCFPLNNIPYVFDTNGVRSAFTGNYGGKYYYNSLPYSEPEFVTLSVGATEREKNLSWISAIETEGEVRLAEASTVINGVFPSTYQKISVKSELSSYSNKYSKSATFSLLKENTRYAYIIAEENYSQVSDIYYFETGSFGDFEFVFCADPQIKTQAHGTMWADTVNKINSNFNAEFIITGGDQIENAGSKEQISYFLLNDFSSVAVAPTVAFPHDDGGTLYLDHFNLPNFSTQYGVSPTFANYSYMYNNVLIMHINLSDKTAINNGEHQAFVKKTIEAAPNAKWKIVVMHNSIFSTGSHGYADWVENGGVNENFNILANSFSENGVDLVLSGHDHLYTRSKLMDGINLSGDTVSNNTVTNADGTLYICSGSSTGSKYGNIMFDEYFVANDRDDERKMALKISVTDASLTVDAYFLDDMSIFDSFTIKTAEDVIVNDSTGESYADFESAIENANEGDVITLMKDAEIGEALLTNGVTLDLNGKTVKVESMIVFSGSQIVDSVGGGLIDVPKDKLLITTQTSDSIVLYIDNEDDTKSGYTFTKVTDQKSFSTSENGFELIFRPSLNNSTYLNKAMFSDGAKDNALDFVVRLEDNNGNIIKEFIYTDGLVAEVYTNTLALRLTVRGANKYEQINVSYILISQTGMECVVNAGTYVSG